MSARRLVEIEDAQDRIRAAVSPLPSEDVPLGPAALGRVLAEASHDKEEILLGEVDLHQLEDIRRNWPFLRDRRIDSYAPITSRMLDGK